MANRTCSIDNCERKHFGLGYCQTHHRRFKKYGDPLAGGTHYKTPDESLAARTKWEGDCLVWTGSLMLSGYGTITAHGKNRAAHRYAWERVNGPIPDGMFIDHICHNRPCVRIEHLRMVTHKQNMENVRGARADNHSSGILGVSWNRQYGKWRAQIVHHGKWYYVGRYVDLEDAAEAVRLKRIELFTHNDHDRAA